MYRLFAFLVLVIAIVLVVGFTRGWFVVTSHDNPADDHVDVGLTIDKGNIRQDTNQATARAKALGDEAKRDAQNLAEKVDRKLHERTGLSVSPDAVTMNPGNTATLTVTRDATEVKAEQLGLIPSSGSNLEASGGSFAENARETTVTITAPRDAHDGTVRLDSAHGSQTVKVSISNTHE